MLLDPHVGSNTGFCRPRDEYSQTPVAARVYAFLALVAILIATLYPLKFEGREDSFPLSNYPMFARARKQPVTRMFYFVATTPDQQRKYVAPEFVGNVEVLQARSLIAGAVSRGGAASQKLCGEVAGRLTHEPGYAGAVLTIVDGTHNAIEFLTEDKLGSERVLTRCTVPGGGG